MDLQPRYSLEELENLEKIHQDEEKENRTPLDSDTDIDSLLN